MLSPTCRIYRPSAPRHTLTSIPSKSPTCQPQAQTFSFHLTESLSILFLLSLLLSSNPKKKQMKSMERVTNSYRELKTSFRCFHLSPLHSSAPNRGSRASSPSPSSTSAQPPAPPPSAALVGCTAQSILPPSPAATHTQIPAAPPPLTER